MITIYFIVSISSAWTVKFNANPCAFHEHTQWTTIEVDRPCPEHPLVILSPGIAFRHTHKLLKSVAGFYGPRSVMMSPFNGVYSWLAFPDQQMRAQMPTHDVNDLNYPGLFAQVTWLKSLIERNIIPSAIVAGSKGGFIVNDIWKYVWRGRTVIYNGATAMVPNIVKDEVILPIFVISGRDEIFGNMLPHIAKKWRPEERGLIYWVNQYHIPSYPPMVEQLPSYLENGADAEKTRRQVLHYSFRFSEMGNLLQADGPTEAFKKYRPAGSICASQNLTPQ